MPLTLLALLHACQPADTSTCEPGTTSACACGDATGEQICLVDGTLTACDCPTEDSPVDDSPPEESDLPPDPTFATLAGTVSGRFATHPSAMGALGLQAGHNACTYELGGPAHVCDYEELVVALERGELSDIPAGTTAWVQRTTVVTLDDITYPPGPGGRCNDWNLDSDHLADGEYASFDTQGVPTWHLDTETQYDGISTEWAQPGMLSCGSPRSLLCCHGEP